MQSTAEQLPTDGDGIRHGIQEMSASIRRASNFLTRWGDRPPVQVGKVVFYSFSERFDCNPRAVCEELLRRHMGADLVWVAERERVRVPDGVGVVCGKGAMRRELATAQVIVANSRLGNYWDKGYTKKPGQVYIQTWHGSRGIKKMEGQAVRLRESYRRRAMMDSRNIDYLISNCAWLTKAYRESFFYEGEILQVGSPRNDVLVQASAGNAGALERAARVRGELGLEEDARTVLLAPTFRDDHSTPPLPDVGELRHALVTRFGGEWRVLLRWHPGLHRPSTPFNALEVQDVSDFPDMADLLLVADSVITDYSSCIYDFLLTRRPAFVYASDCKAYERERGLYYPLRETPFAVAEDTGQLAQAITDFDALAYRARVDAFLKDKGSTDDGHASARVADLIERILREGGGVA